MSVNISWEITQMKNKISDGGVFFVEWVCYAIRNTYHKSISDTIEFTPDISNPNFTPLNDLTQEQVLGWVWNQVNKNEIEQMLIDELEEAVNPTVDYTLPWL